MTSSVPGGAYRLLDHAQIDLAAHERLLGPVPWRGGPRSLIPLVEASGLTGRGGAAFPTARKLAAVAARPKAVVIANGAEAEPASAKDRTLLHRAPHLVLDGLQLAAEAVGAARACAYVREEAVQPLQQALAARRRGDRYRVDVVVAPPTFVAGEESAAVSAAAGGPALPLDRPYPIAHAGVGGCPTLVQNVETLAHLALIARYGPDRFRREGTPDEPGTFLATISGTVARPGVYEIPFGAPLGDAIAAAGGVTAPLQALLVGGFHGTWVMAPPQTPLSRAGLYGYGASPGSGVLLALPYGRCGLSETAHVLDYLAGQSAQQCGPCLNGLPRLAASFGWLARGERDHRLATRVEQLCATVEGRGACRHPDGSVRLVRSAMQVFGPEVALHLDGRCSAT
jgi:NADH:ubiquinone oxidoreductase subunit F (NADH-binding)